MVIKKDFRSSPNQQSLNKFGIFLTAFFLVVSAFIFLIFAQAQNSGSTEALNKYTASIERVDKLIKTFPTDIFSDPFLTTAKQPIALPLVIGNVGKSDPFAIPKAPETPTFAPIKKTTR